MSTIEKVWVGLKIIVPKHTDRITFLRRQFPHFQNFYVTTGCGRKVAFCLDDIPSTDWRCICGEEFFVQWHQSHESKQRWVE